MASLFARYTRGPDSRRAFTLIEVLVVVAIIALLLAILLPSLKKARDQAKVVSCKMNLHDFGLSIQQYATDHNGFFPLASYMGSTIWYDQPEADDNLFVLWFRKYTRNVATYTCPGTTHRVRTPERVVKVPVTKGIDYQIYTNGELRNDFEFHAQLKQQAVHKGGGIAQVKGFGTSYEYGGWLSSGTTTKIDWWPLNDRRGEYGGEPMKIRTFYPSRQTLADGTTQIVRRPASSVHLMKDADEGLSWGITGAGASIDDVVGAPPGGAHNNVPEPWDNHGAKLSNVLYADMHAQSQGIGYWETWIRDNPPVKP